MNALRCSTQSRNAIPKNRLNYVDMAKAFSLFLVVLFHRQGIQQTALQIVGAAFHMPIFFFLFGLTSAGGTKSETFWPLVRKRFVSLMVPYFLWSAIYASFRGISLKQLCLIAWVSHPSIIAAYSNAALWFLPAIFFAAVLFDAVTFFTEGQTRGRLVRYLSAMCIAGAASVLFAGYPMKFGYPLNMDVALSGFLFMMTGHLMKGLFRKAEAMRLLSLLLISAFLCAATLAFSLCNTVRVVMAIHVYGKYSLFLLAGVTGSMGIALGMMLLERVAGSLAKPLSWLGRHSLFVFASHHIAFQMMNDLLRCLSIDGPNLLMYQLIYTALAILLCSAVCRITVGFVPALEGK